MLFRARTSICCLIIIFQAALASLIFIEKLFAQEESFPRKYALVIGNGAYSNLSRLANPVNDADDIAVVLGNLGFTVDRVLDGSLEEMEAGVTRLKNRLSGAADSYGFFFYAGHGVQSNGENYLIPVDANIPSESYLRNRALSVQIILDDLNDARNNLNVVVLDACRDNPFGWARSSSRGLAMLSGQPAGSIIVYATSVGQRASDGSGRNGLFTGQLLNNLADPSLEVNEVFRRTGADVSQVSANQQIPAIYSQFFGIAYLGAGPKAAKESPPAAVQPSLTTHSPESAPAVQPPLTTPSSEPAPAVQPPTEPAIAAFTGPTPLPSPEEPERFVPPPAPLDRTKYLTTVGVSAGTTFSAPWLTATIHGTLPLINGGALEIGLDYGIISRIENAEYYSLYPFVHYLNFIAYNGRLKGGWYLGGGAGWMFADYKFPTGDVKIGMLGFDLVAGTLLMNFLDISYTLRTDFKSASNKIMIGYSYRFFR